MKSAPKDPKQNAEYRRAILERANKDVAFQEECWIRCSRDIIWYLDVFGWTFNPKEHADVPVRPFILWPFQESAVQDLAEAVGKSDRLIEKSRDMGASWLCLSVFVWRWHFRKNQTFLLISRIEDLVDKKNEPDCLFWKIDFLLSQQPGWLLPSTERNRLSLRNLDNNSTITGSSTTSETGRGGRKTAILLDEFAAVDDGYAMLSSTRDNTNSRFLNSTPKGAVGAYYDTRQKWLQLHPERVVRLHWSTHPMKNPGLYTTDSGEEGGTLKILDEGFEFPPGYKFVRDGKLRSPWYDDQCERAANEQEIAQELDIDYAASGWQFFPAKELEKLSKLHARNPLHVGELSFTGDGVKPHFMEMKGARLKLWFDPLVNGNADVNGKPPPDKKYAIGCDIATGKGGEMSSNSVATVIDVRTGEKVAEFCTNSIFPDEFAVYCIALCRWFNGAILNWERNGPGGTFTAKVRQTDYRTVYYSEASESKFERKKTREPGIHTTKESKKVLLSEFRRAVLDGKFIERDEESYREYGEYVHYPNGEISHARSKTTQDPTATGEAHGDRVISCAMAYRAMNDVPKIENDASVEPPPSSYQHRRNQYEKRNRKKLCFQDSRYARSYF